jgi:hypothetical protein
MTEFFTYQICKTKAIMWLVGALVQEKLQKLLHEKGKEIQLSRLVHNCCKTKTGAGYGY